MTLCEGVYRPFFVRMSAVYHRWAAKIDYVDFLFSKYKIYTVSARNGRHMNAPVKSIVVVFMLDTRQLVLSTLFKNRPSSVCKDTGNLRIEMQATPNIVQKFPLY